MIHTSKATPPYPDARHLGNVKHANCELMVEGFPSSHRRVISASPVSPDPLGACFISVNKKYSLFCRLVSLFCLLGNFAANPLMALDSRVR